MRKITLLSVLCLMLSFSAFNTTAQYTHDDSRHHIYPSITHIHPTEQSVYGEGYMVASTAPQGGPYSRIQRLKIDGNIVWNKYLKVSGNPCRVTHIEKYKNPSTGDTEYLLVGSVIHSPSVNTLYLAKMDDNGNIIIANEYKPGVYNNFIGVKGIYSPSLNEFVIVASENNGFSSTNKKRIFVAGIKFSNLYVSWQHTLNTPNTLYDFDFGNEIVEISPSKFAIVGTSNENATSNSEAGVLAFGFDQSAILWKTQFATTSPGTGHYDNAASAVMAQGELWVLHNTTAGHYYNLTALDPGTGNIVKKYKMFDPVYDKYGFTIRQSIFNPNKLIIGGYQYTYNQPFNNNEILPFLAQFDIPSVTIDWNYSYKAQNPGLGSYTENQLLFKRNLGQMPLFYNTMFTVRADYKGYVALGNEDIISGRYGIKLIGTKLNGKLYDPNCGMIQYNPAVGNSPRYTFYNLTVQPNSWNEGPTSTNVGPVGINTTNCGPIMKRQITSVSQLSDEKSVLVYPNPASNEITIKGAQLENLAQLAVIDLQGKVILEQTVKAQEQFTLSLDNVQSGVYFIKLTGKDKSVTTKQIHVLK